MLNDKQEKFCQNYVVYRNATEAAKQAGYSESSAYNQGYRLLQMEEVLERIEELEQELTTDINVIKELENTFQSAKSSGHTNSALKALELLSKVRGPEIVGYMEILGEKKVIELVSRCSFNQSLSFEDDLDQHEDDQVNEGND
jgi:phage terminase small subunit